jgi:hypothetical protein
MAGRRACKFPHNIFCMNANFHTNKQIFRWYVTVSAKVNEQIMAKPSKHCTHVKFKRSPVANHNGWFFGHLTCQSPFQKQLLQQQPAGDR